MISNFIFGIFIGLAFAGSGILTFVYSDEIIAAGKQLTALLRARRTQNVTEN